MTKLATIAVDLSRKPDGWVVRSVSVKWPGGEERTRHAGADWPYRTNILAVAKAFALLKMEASNGETSGREATVLASAKTTAGRVIAQLYNLVQDAQPCRNRSKWVGRVFDNRFGELLHVTAGRECSLRLNDQLITVDDLHFTRDGEGMSEAELKSFLGSFGLEGCQRLPDATEGRQNADAPSATLRDGGKLRRESLRVRVLLLVSDSRGGISVRELDAKLRDPRPHDVIRGAVLPLAAEGLLSFNSRSGRVSLTPKGERYLVDHLHAS